MHHLLGLKWEHEHIVQHTHLSTSSRSWLLAPFVGSIHVILQVLKRSNIFHSFQQSSNRRSVMRISQNKLQTITQNIPLLCINKIIIQWQIVKSSMFIQRLNNGVDQWTQIVILKHLQNNRGDYAWLIQRHNNIINTWWNQLWINHGVDGIV